MSNEATTCASCGGQTKAERVILDRRIAGRLVVFEEVPASVCEDCGEVWLEAHVLHAMEDAAAGGARPSRTLSVPAISLEEVRAA
jgi:HTH-type transcriptional regulator / antitoxin MqsA